MPKTIVFCADGTWNGPGEPDDVTAHFTNVFKLFLNLAGDDAPGTLMLAKEQERTLADAAGNVLQVAKYLHGVGDSDNFLARILGGAIGEGLIVRIVRGYTFVSRNYRAGDRIFIVGFSRGAYTARALAGLICASGLLDATRLDLSDKATAYRLGSAVWYAHRRHAVATNPNLLGQLEERVLDLPGFFLAPPAQQQMIQAPIEAVAVWETVGALGIPEFALNASRLDAFQFADTQLSSVVRHGLHAIAVDEQRGDFTPTLWSGSPQATQVLFPGAHGDVGGGYPISGNESGISDCALAWMTEQLTALGVRFAATPTCRAAPDAAGIAHQPWAHFPWTFGLRGPRSFPAGLVRTQCLLDRLAGGPVLGDPGGVLCPYAPVNLGLAK
jgi:uncharacterized protein (DUF2235 family)